MELKKFILTKLEERLPSFLEEKNEELNHWIEYNDKENKKIIVFGAGGMGEICCNYLERLGFKVDLICDNNTNRQGIFVTERGNRIVVAPVDKLDNCKEIILCFIATGDHHFKDISKQLEKYNLAETIYKWHLDFYLETIEMAYKWGKAKIINKITELLDLFNDEESLKIILCHLEKVFQLKIEDKNNIDFKFLCEKPQYFLKRGQYLENGECLVDCGAFIGDTLAELVNLIKYEDFKRYDCYELDNTNYRILKDYVENLSDELKNKIYLHQCGVGDKDENIYYNFNQGGSCIGKNGTIQGEIVKLDDEFESKRVSFVKMDIEGSEQSALRGGKNIIQRDKPQCAICVYHNVRSLWEIPIILKKYVPEYSLILRHHTEKWDDTVCYARVGEWDV